VLFLLALLAFVSLGLPDALLGVAWPTLRREMGRPLDALGLVLGAMVAGYLLSSASSGGLSRRLGVGGLLVGSGLLVVAGNLTIAVAPWFALVLLGSLASGLGGGAIDAAINAHAAHHFAPGRVVWLHACWGIGAALGSATMAVFVTHPGAGWRGGYAAVSAAVAVLALGFWSTRGRWHASHDAAAAAAPLYDSLREGAVRANVAVFFLYTGVEGGVGQWAYTLLTEGRGFAGEIAGTATAAYWGSLTLGRLVFGAVAHHASPSRIVLGAMGCAPLGTLVLASGAGGPWPLAALGLLGFAAGPVFPLLISLTPARVGAAHAANAVGFQVAAASLGSAMVPALAGVLGRRLGLDWIPGTLFAAACAILVLELLVRRVSRAPLTAR
jgi:fucose permease